MPTPFSGAETRDDDDSRAWPSKQEEEEGAEFILKFQRVKFERRESGQERGGESCWQSVIHRHARREAIARFRCLQTNGSGAGFLLLPLHADAAADSLRSCNHSPAVVLVVMCTCERVSARKKKLQESGPRDQEK